MTKGILIGVGIAVLGFVGYIVLIKPSLSSPPPVSEDKTVAQLRADADPNNIELARTSPEAALEQLDIKDIPAFIAFLDLDMSVTDQSLETYRTIFKQVAGYYANDAPVQIVEAIFRIHETQEYFDDLNYRAALEYLQDTVPVTFDPENPIGQSVKRVRVVADEIHDYLVAAYMKPQMERLERQQAEHAQLQQKIQSNIKNIHSRNIAQSRDVARYGARNQQYIRRNMTYHYNDYNNRYRR